MVEAHDGTLEEPGVADLPPDDLEIALADGRALRVRPIRGDDGERLAAFHDSLSPESIYFRFFAAHPHLSPAEVDRFTHVDGDRRVGLVVVDDERIVAVGRYDRLGETPSAEVAFVVADSYQHQGIATILLARLARLARHHGIDTFIANTLFVNDRMRRVFVDAGYDVHAEVVEGVVRVDFRIGTRPFAAPM